MMMIKAGKPVDIVVGEIALLLERGDVLIDGGNSLFTDTQRRGKELEETGIHFVGMGVSGGEEGALKGPSLMPGGSRESWEIIAPIFRKIAAHVDGEPCCRYMGPDGAGHYVKMVHNGIEYGDIQLICEAYAILKDILEMQYATRFTPRKLFLTRREWSFCVLEARNTNGTSTSAISPPSGGAAASFAPNFSTESSRLISAILSSTTFCSTVISREPSKRRNATGALR